MVAGCVQADIGGHQDLGLINATVTLQGTSYTATTDTNGNFYLPNIPAGTYTLMVNAPGFTPLVQSITVVEEQPLNLSLPGMTLFEWDVNGDGVLGLEESIRALQVVSGLRSE